MLVWNRTASPRGIRSPRRRSGETRTRGQPRCAAAWPCGGWPHSLPARRAGTARGCHLEAAPSPLRSMKQGPPPQGGRTLFGPSGETRTRGLQLPKLAPYQLGNTRIKRSSIVCGQSRAPVRSSLPWKAGDPSIAPSETPRQDKDRRGGACPSRGSSANSKKHYSKRRPGAQGFSD